MKRKRFNPLQLLLFVLLAGSMVFLVLYRAENKRLKKENDQFRNAQQLKTEALSKENGLALLMTQVLTKVEAELHQHATRQLSEVMIKQIADLSYSFTSGKYVTSDSTTQFPLSPARGQLMLMLLRMNIDTITMSKIKAQTSFAGAVLREADLRGADLSRMDLRGANLKDANLEGANLEKTNLMYATLWGAQMNKAKLRDAFAKRADMRWVELNEADLTGADLHEADISSGKLRKSILRKSILQWTDFKGAMLNEAVFDSADMFRTVLTKAELPGAHLQAVNLTLANVCQANLLNADFTNANLHDVVVAERDWLELTTSWKIIGAPQIQQAYTIVDEKSSGVHLYQLKKKQ